MADVFATAMISGKLCSGAGIVMQSDPEVRMVQFMCVSMIAALIAGCNGKLCNSCVDTITGLWSDWADHMFG